jgi:hypothetical protein
MDSRSAVRCVVRSWVEGFEGQVGRGIEKSVDLFGLLYEAERGFDRSEGISLVLKGDLKGVDVLNVVFEGGC